MTSDELIERLETLQAENGIMEVCVPDLEGTDYEPLQDVTFWEDTKRLCLTGREELARPVAQSRAGG